MKRAGGAGRRSAPLEGETAKACLSVTWREVKTWRQREHRRIECVHC